MTSREPLTPVTPVDTNVSEARQFSKDEWSQIPPEGCVGLIQSESLKSLLPNEGQSHVISDNTECVLDDFTKDMGNHLISLSSLSLFVYFLQIISNMNCCLRCVLIMLKKKAFVTFGINPELTWIKMIWLKKATEQWYVKNEHIFNTSRPLSGLKVALKGQIS